MPLSFITPSAGWVGRWLGNRRPSSLLRARAGWTWIRPSALRHARNHNRPAPPQSTNRAQPGLSSLPPGPRLTSSLCDLLLRLRGGGLRRGPPPPSAPHCDIRPFLQRPHPPTIPPKPRRRARRGASARFTSKCPRMSHYFAPSTRKLQSLRVENLTIWVETRPFWPISVHFLRSDTHVCDNTRSRRRHPPPKACRKVAAAGVCFNGC